jgi:hypothetical protein
LEARPGTPARWNALEDWLWSPKPEAGAISSIG